MYDVVNYVRIRLSAMARTERGASAVEYGLLVALIAVFIIGAVTLLGGHLRDIFNNTATSIGDGTTTS
jgi:pilus assembly protein Flp/PilA